MIDSEYWARYYEVTVDRPAWETVRLAIASFADEGRSGRAARPGGGGAPLQPRFAVDLGCGAGRDARALLLAGWRVLAIDREPAGLEILASRAAEEGLAGLQTQVAGLAEVVIPACDLVNASLSLPFLPPDDFWPTWQRALAAVAPGGRVSAMLFGDRDAGADDPAMTCPSPEVIRSTLAGFEIEHWLDCEEDSLTALGEPHHFHRVELVARRSTAPAG